MQRMWQVMSVMKHLSLESVSMQSVGSITHLKFLPGRMMVLDGMASRPIFRTTTWLAVTQSNCRPRSRIANSFEVASAKLIWSIYTWLSL